MSERPSNEPGSASPDTTLGRTIGDRFRVDAVIGEGAMGVVYRAHHLGLRKDVALKLLHRQLTANTEMVARFDREAAAASRLDHANCVRVLDFGASEDGRRYLVMDLLEGQELAALLGAPLQPVRAIEILEQVLRGLGHAHAQGLVHRDVKPENIFLGTTASGEVIKLLDFGIAKIQDAQGVAPLTRAGAVFGTPCYMSPEQCAGKSIDARTDLYSAGIVMYEMLSGNAPFPGDDATDILRGHIMKAPPPLPDSIPAALRDFVMKMIEKKPDDRFSSASAAIAGLEAVKRAIASESAAAVPPRRSVALPPPAPALSRAKPPLVSSPTPAAAPATTVRAASSSAPASAEPRAPAPPPPLPETPKLAASPPPPPPPAAAPGAAAESSVGPSGAGASSPGPRASADAIVRDAIERARTRLQQQPWIKPALIGGAALLLVITIAAWPSRDERDVAPSVGKDAPAPVAADAEGTAKDADEPSDDPEPGEPAIEREEGGTAADEPAKADRALRANLASVDALLESKHYDSARIMLGPLLEVYEDEPGLYWRMGRVLARLDPKNNATAALEHYRNALALDAALLDDPAFAGELWPLLEQPKHRALATDIAVELLGDAGHEPLARWINVQAAPLGHATRHRAIDHLTASGKAASINAALQAALDLWQAQSTDAPCDVFAGALAAAGEDPDSFLWGSIVDAPIPTAPDGTECPGLAETRDALAARYAERYAGLARVLPTAYAKKRRKAK